MNHCRAILKSGKRKGERCERYNCEIKSHKEYLKFVTKPEQYARTKTQKTKRGTK
jgi:hypothetical protein